jgi:hypothetical protein
LKPIDPPGFTDLAVRGRADLLGEAVGVLHHEVRLGEHVREVELGLRRRRKAAAEQGGARKHRGQD